MDTSNCFENCGEQLETKIKKEVENRKRKPPIPSSESRERDEAIRKCFKAGMTQAQMMRMSKCVCFGLADRCETRWTHEISTQQQVSDIWRRLRLVRSSPVQPHVKDGNELLIDVISEGHAKGWVTLFWEKESTVFEVGLRSDLFVDMRKDGKAHIFFGEMQISDLTVAQWISKLKPYAELYERKDRASPFMVLIRCSGSYNKARAKTAMNEVLSDKTSIWPFLIWDNGWKDRFGNPRGLVE